MNSFLLLMSGPLMAAVRYGVTAAGAAAVARGWTDGATATAVGGGIIAAISAGIGMLTSTKSVAVQKVADIKGARVQLPNGDTVGDAHTAAAVIAADPTWSNPNAR